MPTSLDTCNFKYNAEPSLRRPHNHPVHNFSSMFKNGISINLAQALSVSVSVSISSSGETWLSRMDEWKIAVVGPFTDKLNCDDISLSFCFGIFVVDAHQQKLLDDALGGGRRWKFGGAEAQTRGMVPRTPRRSHLVSRRQWQK